MVNMVKTGDDVKYARPPVRTTVFAVFIDPIEFDINLVAKLRERWMSHYPGGVAQSPPRFRPAELPSTDPFAAPWPMPSIQLVDASLSRVISFQFDQISLTWRFDPDGEGDQYQGYDALADELNERFAEFVEIADDVSSGTINVQGCQCSYSNTLAGIGGQDWLAGHATNWLSSAEPQGFEDADYFGFRLHRQDEDDGVNRSVWVQLDEGAAQRPELDINVVALPADEQVASNTDPKALARRLLDSAHKLENKTFEASFSESMKKNWR